MQESSFQIIDKPDPLSLCILNIQPTNKENSDPEIYHIISVYRDSTVFRTLPLHVHISNFPYLEGSKRGLNCFSEMESMNGISATYTVSKGNIHYIFVDLEKGTFLSDLKVFYKSQGSASNIKATHFNMYNAKRFCVERLNRCFDFLVEELDSGRVVADSHYNLIAKGKNDSDNQDPSENFVIEPRNNMLPYNLEIVCAKEATSLNELAMITSDIYHGEVDNHSWRDLLSDSQSIIKGKEPNWTEKDMAISHLSFQTANSVMITEEMLKNSNDPKYLVGTAPIESGLRCLCAIQPLVDDFSSEENTNLTTGKLSRLFSMLVKNVKEDNQVLCELARFVAEIKQNMKTTSENGFDFLQEFLSKIHIECNKAEILPTKEKEIHYYLDPAIDITKQVEKYSAQLHQREDSIIASLFNGELLTHSNCTECKEVTLELSSVQSLSLQFKDVVGSHQRINIEALLNRFIKPEKYAKKLYCQKCKQNTNCLLKKSILRLPRVLILHLDRFQGAEKIKTQVVFPIKDLNLSSCLESSESEISADATYSLSAVIHQYGDTSKGRCVAECKSLNDGLWYRFDDSRMIQIYQKEKIESSSAYVLFYVKNPSKIA